MTSNPTGPITSNIPGGASSLQWEAITRYDAFIRAAADPLGWAIERVRGHIVIESRGDPRAVQRNSQGNSYGLMQVVPYANSRDWGGWYPVVIEQAKLPRTATQQQVINALYDPKTNIAVGVQVLEAFWKEYGTADAASSAFFTGRPDWGGADTVNGTTGALYRNALNALIAEQKAFAPPDPISIIVGGAPYEIISAYGDSSSLPYYDYGRTHGAIFDRCGGRCHTGIDVSGTLGQTLYSPGPGVVTCAGTGNGPGSWQTGCAAFPDYFGKGAGRVEVLLDSGESVILGHCSTALVRPGQRVVAGQAIATMGGMNSIHIHLEVRVWKENGRCS
ncbi:MAG: M23 family metallopeptidase [Dehalococcoidia bacterium]|nr:M23 family metallopeptidase [Dehalococcoidia bacterium]